MTTDPRQLLDEAVAIRGDDPDEAHRLACAARTVARANGRLDLEGEAVYHLASIAHDRGEVEGSFALASEAITLAARDDDTSDRSSDDPSGRSSDDSSDRSSDRARLVLAWSRHLLGIVYYRTGNLAAALDQCVRALDAFRASSPRREDEGRVLQTIAAAQQAMGDHVRAEETYLDVLAINETIGRDDVEAMVLGNLARLRVRRGAYEDAIETGRNAAKLAAESAGHLEGSVRADLAEAFAALGQTDEAEQQIEAAATSWWRGHADDDDRHAAALCIARARVALHSGDADRAVGALIPALDLCDRIDDRQIELEVHETLATAYAEIECFEAALDHRERHFALHREVFSDAAELRLRTVQIASSHEIARHQAELTELRAASLAASFARAHTDPDAYHLEAFERLAALAEYRGGNTTAHTAEVGDLSAEIAHAIGEQPAWCERLRLAARLHDIGKVAVADSVLLKRGPLTVQDYDEVKQHTIIGRRLLSGVSTPLFALAAEIAWAHHEWWDGTGYPNGLSGESIPLSGRIVAIADVFDALITRRVYKRQWSLGEAVRFVTSGAGAQFDPRLITAFESVLAARHPNLGLS